MKKLVITSMLLLFALAPILAQDGEIPREFRQRLEAMKVAFITDKIALTPEQAQEFWPVYNAYQEEQQTVRQKYRAAKTINQMSDAELKTHLMNGLEAEEELLLLKKSFFEKAQKSISIRQIALLREAEKEFNKEVLRRMMARQQETRKRRIGNN